MHSCQPKPIQLSIPIGTVLNLRTTTLQKCEAVPRRARIKAHRLVYHSTLGLRVIKKKRKGSGPLLLAQLPTQRCTVQGPLPSEERTTYKVLTNFT